MKSEKGFAHALILLILVGGLAVGVYLVNNGGKLNFFSRAATSLSSPIYGPTAKPSPISSPITKLSPTPKLNKSVRVVLPNGGETLTVGNTYRIRWNSTNVEKVSLFYYSGSKTLTPITPVGKPIPNVGYYDWKVDINNAPNTKVKITVMANYDVFKQGKSNYPSDESDRYFTVLKPSFTPTPTPVSSSKGVFVTSTTYDGNLGGLSGADAKCQTQASVANLGGTWKAWISDSVRSASSRLYHNSGPYKSIIGDIVANNWTDLTDGTLINSITVDERGTFQGIIEPFSVWTDTRVDGSIPIEFGSAVACKDWTSSSSLVNGIGGASWKKDSNWSWVGTQGSPVTQPCNTKKRLYCFEQ